MTFPPPAKLLAELNGALKIIALEGRLQPFLQRLLDAVLLPQALSELAEVGDAGVLLALLRIKPDFTQRSAQHVGTGFGFLDRLLDPALQSRQA